MYSFLERLLEPNAAACGNRLRSSCLQGPEFRGQTPDVADSERDDGKLSLRSPSEKALYIPLVTSSDSLLEQVTLGVP